MTFGTGLGLRSFLPFFYFYGCWFCYLCQQQPTPFHAPCAHFTLTTNDTMSNTISGSTMFQQRSKGETGRRLLSQSLPSLDLPPPPPPSLRVVRINSSSRYDKNGDKPKRRRRRRRRSSTTLTGNMHASHTEHMPGPQWGHSKFQGLHDWSEADHAGEVEVHARLYDDTSTSLLLSKQQSGKQQQQQQQPQPQPQSQPQSQPQTRLHSQSLPRLAPQADMSFSLPPVLQGGGKGGSNNKSMLTGSSHQWRRRTTSSLVVPTHVCPVCSQRFRRRITLEVHQRVLHPWTAASDGTILPDTGKKPFECKECGKGFVRKEQYFAHKKLHTGAQFLTCGKCSKRMVVRRTEPKHARVHVSAYPPFDCVCGRNFKTNDALNEHLNHREVHRPLVCICGEQFKQQFTIKVRDDVRESALANMTDVGKRWTKLTFV